MPMRILNRSFQTALDILILSLAYWLAFLFRFEFSIPPAWLRVLLTTWPYVVLLHYVGLVVFGVPRMSWRYISIGDVARISIAVTASTALLSSIRVFGPFISQGFSILVIPLGVLAMNFVLGLIGLVGLRA